MARPVQPWRHKFKVSPPDERREDGILFDSKKERRRYCELRAARAMGDVLFFLRQVPFHLPGGVVYRADFLVFWRDGSCSIEDVKGMRTESYKAKKRMVEELYAPAAITEL